MKKSQQWLQEHHATIGGSNSAAAVGENEYKSPLELYHEIVLGQYQDLERDPDALRGVLLEPVARERLRGELGMEVLEHDQNKFERHPAYRWAHALPDGWIHYHGDRIPVEIKVPHPRNWERLDWKIPQYIRCQGIHNAAVLRMPALYLACLNPITMELWTKLIEPTQEEIDYLMGREEVYWETYIVPQVPPPAQTRDDFKLRWGTGVPGTSVIADEATEKAWGKLVLAKQEVKTWEKRSQELEFIVKTFLADRSALLDEEGHVLATWKGQLSHPINVKRLADELPDVADTYRDERESRTFLVKTKHLT